MVKEQYKILLMKSAITEYQKIFSDSFINTRPYLVDML
jgi:hypothetical protein